MAEVQEGGQVAETSDSPVEGQVSETTEASSVSGTEAEQTSPSTPASEESFFDPSKLSPELQSAYKQMQAAFTKKTQAVAKQSSEYSQYKAVVDEFNRDPQGMIRRLAMQYGLPIQEPEKQEFNPNSWEDVLSAAEQRAAEKAKSEILQTLQPFIKDYQQNKQQVIERQFDKVLPEWRNYELEMTQLIQKHPSLVNDPEGLLRLAVPQHVWESKATEKALKKLQQKADGAQVSGGSSTTKGPSETPPANMSFADSVAWAQKQLASQGIRPG